MTETGTWKLQSRGYEKGRWPLYLRVKDVWHISLEKHDYAVNVESEQRFSVWERLTSCVYNIDKKIIGKYQFKTTCKCGNKIWMVLTLYVVTENTTGSSELVEGMSNYRVSCAALLRTVCVCVCEWGDRSV
jgi:hypothetical protein